MKRSVSAEEKRDARSDGPRGPSSDDQESRSASDRVADLHRAVGNQAVQQLLRGDGPATIQRQAAASGGATGAQSAAGATGQQSATSPRDAETYEIQPGDTLSSIAREHGVPGGWQALWNFADNRSVIGDNPDLIYPKDVITVPAGGGPTPASAASTGATAGATRATGGSDTAGATAASARQGPQTGAGQYQAENRISFSTEPGTLASIHFPTGVRTLDSADQQTLAQLDAKLEARMSDLIFNPAYDSFRLRFEGYADRQRYARGSELRNTLLSGDRARNAKTTLQGLPGYRRLRQSNRVLSPTHIAKGAVGPAPGQATKAELATHRRVDVVLEPQGSGRKKNDDEEDKPTNDPLDRPDVLKYDQPPPGMSAWDVTSIAVQSIDAIANIAVLFGASMAWAGATAILGMVVAPFAGAYSIGSAHNINKEAHDAAGYCYGGTEAFATGTSGRIVTQAGEFDHQYFFDGFGDTGGYDDGADRMLDRLQTLEGQSAGEREEYKQRVWDIMKESESEAQRTRLIKAEFTALSTAAKSYLMSQYYQHRELGEVPVETLLNKMWKRTASQRAGTGWDIWERRDLVWWGGPGFE